jgi:hypothetical protein
VTEALIQWRNAQDRPEDAPLVIVATAGGGITAAYWTASVLGGLEDAYPTRFSGYFGTDEAHPKFVHGFFGRRLGRSADPAIPAGR